MEDGIRGLLPRYYDGELSEDIARQVELHLPGCAECRAELRELRLLSTALSPTDEPASAADAEAFWQTLQPQLGLQRASVPWRAWLPGLLLLTLYALAGLLLAVNPLFRLAGIEFSLPPLLLPGLPVPIIGVSSTALLAFCLLGSAGALYLVWLAFWWSRYAAETDTAHS